MVFEKLTILSTSDEPGRWDVSSPGKSSASPSASASSPSTSCSESSASTNAASVKLTFETVVRREDRLGSIGRDNASGAAGSVRSWLGRSAPDRRDDRRGGEGGRALGKCQLLGVVDARLLDYRSIQQCLDDILLCCLKKRPFCDPGLAPYLLCGGGERHGSNKGVPIQFILLAERSNIIPLERPVKGLNKEGDI